ncbi:unnamed protein product, partial [Amoebophrya sp. A25]
LPPGYSASHRDRFGASSMDSLASVASAASSGREKEEDARMLSEGVVQQLCGPGLQQQGEDIDNEVLRELQHQRPPPQQVHQQESDNYTIIKHDHSCSKND